MTKLLIVDCDDHINQWLQEMFARMGFDTYGTWGAQEAFRLLGSGEFDVLLIDNYLPDLYAGEFLERITRLAAHPRIVVMHRSPLSDRELRHYESLEVLTIHKGDPIKVFAAVSACRSGHPTAVVKLSVTNAG
jgi:DNA-binding response OmpR family regulator